MGVQITKFEAVANRPIRACVAIVAYLGKWLSCPSETSGKKMSCFRGNYSYVQAGGTVLTNCYAYIQRNNYDAIRIMTLALLPTSIEYNTSV